MINPCYKCEDRIIGCHGTCERYIEWKKNYTKEQNELKYYKSIEGGIYDAKCYAISRVRRKK